MLTHPNKVMYPQDGITKQQLADFYTNIQRWVLPYIVKRPLTLVRCPEGSNKPCFYQKHIDTQLPQNIFPIKITEKSGSDIYFYIKNIKGLLELVQMGVLEIHPWGSRIDNVEKPDMITFDLDPAPNVAWEKVIETAHLLKQQLETLNLVSFVKTTGGKGLHVVVPIKRLWNWEQIKNFSHAVVMTMMQQNPNLYVGTMSKIKRQGKIFIDYLRNSRGATSIAAYSTRAKLHAPVSTPLSWDELTPKIHSDTYTLNNLMQRLTKLKTDPWQDFFKIKQKIVYNM